MEGVERSSESGGLSLSSSVRLESTYTAEGEKESHVTSAVHGQGEELLIRTKSAVELLDLEALDEILPIFCEEAER
jgi:hypothetical protein